MLRESPAYQSTFKTLVQEQTNLILSLILSYLSCYFANRRYALIPVNSKRKRSGATHVENLCFAMHYVTPS
jgi:hypothetical protein